MHFHSQVSRGGKLNLRLTVISIKYYTSKVKLQYIFYGTTIMTQYCVHVILLSLHERICVPTERVTLVLCHA
jgi:hypothetical protein